MSNFSTSPSTFINGMRGTFAAAFFLTLSIAPAFATNVTFTTGGGACAIANSGQCSTVVGAQTITFDGLDGTTTSPYVSGIATFSFAGGSPFVAGNASSQFAAPPGDLSDYLSVGSPSKANPVNIAFSTPISYYGFYLGSPDTYNQVTFLEQGNVIGSFSGSTLIPPGNGDQSLGAYINFTAVGGSIDQIILSSSSAALESDNHAYVPTGAEAPEPSTMGLAGAGIAGFAFLLRRRLA